MLCPKCGYITFDKYDACPKCKKDWESIKGKFNGTLSSAEPQCFLGSLLKGEAEEAPVVEGLTPFDGEMSEGRGGDVGSELDEKPPEIPDVELGQEEISIPEFQEEEEDSDLDLALDELPEVDLSPIELKEEAEVTSEGSGPETVFDLGLKALPKEPKKEVLGEDNVAEPDAGEGIEPEKPAMETKTEELELSLDQNELVVEEPAVATDKDEGDISLDLKDIDMSDLVLEKKEAKGEEDVETLDLDMGDADVAGLDLDLSGVAEEPKEDSLPGIDLSMDNEEDVLDLSLDLEAEEPEKPKKDEPKIPDLGLSLDFDE